MCIDKSWLQYSKIDFSSYLQKKYKKTQLTVGTKVRISVTRLKTYADEGSFMLETEYQEQLKAEAAKEKEALAKKENTEKSAPAKESGVIGTKKEKVMAEIFDKEVQLNVSCLRPNLSIKDKDKVEFNFLFRQFKFWIEYRKEDQVLVAVDPNSLRVSW